MIYLLSILTFDYTTFGGFILEQQTDLVSRALQRFSFVKLLFSLHNTALIELYRLYDLFELALEEEATRWQVYLFPDVENL